MAFPQQVDPTTPAGSDSPRLGDNQLRDLKQLLADLFTLPVSPSTISATIGSVSTAGKLTLTNALWNADVIGVPYGGTGLATLTANNVLLGNGTSAPTFVAPGTSGNILTSNGTTWVSQVPTSMSQTPWASDINAAGYKLYGTGGVNISGTGSNALQVNGYRLISVLFWVTNTAGTIQFAIGSGSSSAWVAPPYGSSFAASISGATPTLHDLTTSSQGYGAKLDATFNWMLSITTGNISSDKNIVIAFIESDNTGSSHQIQAFGEGGSLGLRLYTAAGAGAPWTTATIPSGASIGVRIFGFAP
jgi:hypothetical protein